LTLAGLGSGLVNNAATLYVSNGGRLNTRAVSILGSSSAVTVDSGATFETQNTNGIAATGATGAVQTTNRNFSSGAEYIYDGSLAQATGSGLPSIINQMEINNSTTVTLTQSTTCTTQLALDAGVLDDTGKTLVVNTDGGPAVSRGTGWINGSITR